MPAPRWLTKSRTRLARTCVAALLLASGPLNAGRARPQIDDDARLLEVVRTALLAADPTALRLIAAPTMRLGSLQVFLRMAELGPTEVTLRERGRTVAGSQIRIVADVLAATATTGRLATWEFATQPASDDSGRRELTSLAELSAIDGLVRASLDPTRQYALHGFTYQAPDFTLTVEAGQAFVAEVATGHAGLVVRGAGRVRFTPADPVEQSQLRLYGGAPSYTPAFTDAFIRLPPGALATYISQGQLRPVRVVSAAWQRAAGVYDAQARQTFGIDLGDMSRDRWSVTPPYGAAVVEFRTGRRGWLTYTVTPGDADDVSLFERTRKKQIALYSSNATPRTLMLRPGSAYDVQHYDLDLRLDPLRTWISGHAALRIRFQGQPAGAITLRLDESLAISSVSSPELGRLLAVKATGQDEFIVTFPADGLTPAEVQLDIAYAGRFDPQAMDADRLSPASTAPSDGASFTARGGRPTPRYLYSTQRAWYPQAPSRDYATATLRVSTPGNLRAVATGSVTSTVTASAASPDAWTTTTFVADRSIPYISCVLSAWVAVGEAHAGVPAIQSPAAGPGHDTAATTVAITTVASERLRRTSTTLAADAGRMIAFFAEEIGEAPFPTFTIAAIDDELPAGHSPAYFALLQQPWAGALDAWTGDPVAFDDVPDFFEAHEVAHQWWGQAVGYRAYQDQWLSEGLAQYFALRYIHATRGATVSAAVLARMRGTAMPLEAEGPVSLGYRLGHIRGNSRVFRAVLYNKAAVVMDMLRRLIGDEAMTAGLRRFYLTARSRNAGTEELRNALEQASGRSLTRFFDQWIRGAALPTLHLSWHRVADGVAIRIDQLGETFDVPVTIAVESTNGRVETFVMPLTEAVTERRWPVTGAVRRVRAVESDTLARWR